MEQGCLSADIEVPFGTVGEASELGAVEPVMG
jgi:hypothetical protein